MKTIQLFIALIVLSPSLNAQLTITYTINANTGYTPISPYIFGSCNGGYTHTNFMRQGGNRMTGYNWENNASNAGQDYLHQSDDYLPWISGIGAPQNDMPGTVTEAFVDTANAYNAFSAVTLQMAGYVAKDKSGTVTVGETAPSARWCSVQNTKPGPFSLTPSTADNIVYMDEYMNFLISNFGNATTSTGVKAYILDNETTLWPSTHPRIHPTAPTIQELLQRSIPLATRVKQMDANAKVFGPESYGFFEYTQYQGASDWGNYSGTYPMFLSFYLDSMRIASQSFGTRLLDVLSVHWYPDVYVGNIYSSDTTDSVAATRMQLPRSLWDNTYVEDGWIGQWFSSYLPILPHLKNQIATYYPNTQLGITEYDYGADDHISGGIAQADALGAFARTGTSFASKWGRFSGFSLSAVRIYDDIAFPFTGFYARCSTSNLDESTVHCAVEDTVEKTLHIVAINKNLDSTISATFDINSTAVYDSVVVYWFDQFNPAIQTTTIPGMSVVNNHFMYLLNRGSVYHFILKETHTSGVADCLEMLPELVVYPNPSIDQLNLSLGYCEAKPFSWTIQDIRGRAVMNGNSQGLQTAIDISTLSYGTYIVQLQFEEKTITRKFIK
jgi:mannan endo-1,4-beta-mannosidase